jgi:hypothetical protein
VSVHRGGVLRRNFEQFLFIVGGDRNGALAVTRVFAAIDVFSSHDFPLLIPRDRTYPGDRRLASPNGLLRLYQLVGKNSRS